MFAKLCSKLASWDSKTWVQPVSKTRIACDGSLMWKKIHVEIEYLKLEFPILHIPQIDLFLLLLSRSDSSSSSYPIWSSVLLPSDLFWIWFGPPFLCSGSDLICSSIEIESYRLRFTFYKLESIRLEIYVAKNHQISKWNSSLWDLSLYWTRDATLLNHF